MSSKGVLNTMPNELSYNAGRQPGQRPGTAIEFGNASAARGAYGLSNHGQRQPGGTPLSAVLGSSEPELLTIEAALCSLEIAVQRLVEKREGRPTEELRRLVRYARHHYATRRRRDAAFGGLFGEPAWDMLLELFIQSAEGSKTPIKNLCLASCTPTSTAMRWIDRLLELGLIEKSNDDEDARRSLVRLTERGWQAIVAVLQP